MTDDTERRRAAEHASVLKHEIEAAQLHLAVKRAELAALVKRAKGGAK